MAVGDDDNWLARAARQAALRLSDIPVSNLGPGARKLLLGPERPCPSCDGKGTAKPECPARFCDRPADSLIVRQGTAILAVCERHRDLLNLDPEGWRISFRLGRAPVLHRVDDSAGAEWMD